ncbi:hypothetical protein [Pseudomonas sp. PB106]|uniref:hypothetical protein n=1 Tax=Pseudomonas sp. PB106 TaxID=2494699 RepID=UPI00131C8B70|nr:hypothetical protein [Pseudomonas sp. PB106]KAE9643391.1 hypothetical protein EJA71_16805 [Pseudomonas sp. PB106]
MEEQVFANASLKSVQGEQEVINSHGPQPFTLSVGQRIKYNAEKGAPIQILVSVEGIYHGIEEGGLMLQFAGTDDYKVFPLEALKDYVIPTINPK